MFKQNFSLKALGAAAFLGLSTLAVTAMPAQAQSLNTVLDAIKRDSSALNAENQQRIREFQQARDAQASKLAQARGELNTFEARGRALGAEFDVNERALSEMQTQLETEAGDFGELLGQFRQAAGETMPIIRDSLANFEYGGRVETLAKVAEARSLPTREDLDSLPKAMLQEMIAQSEVKRFTAMVGAAGDNNENVEKELMRIGVFTAATTDNGNFVDIVELKGQGGKKILKEFGTQPGGKFASGMSALIGADAGQVVNAPVDPSKGDLLRVFGNLPTLGDRFNDGGPVGLVITALLIVGAIMALFKIFTLFTMGGAMRKSAKTKQAGTGNPLARVFETFENNRSHDIETLELKLDEQILRETPRIERFNDIIKVLAAVAPLLGLLGTVIGMIQTFTSITIYGAGDPKIMAGGISTALMTTVMGLIAAIPLLLLHAVAASMARGNQQILDEQAAGLVAEKAEGAVA